MKFLLHMLVVFALAFSTYASAAPSCCQDQDCGMVQCIQMGCVPAVAPVPVAGRAQVIAEPAARDYAPEQPQHLLAVYEETWTPPD